MEHVIALGGDIMIRKTHTTNPLEGLGFDDADFVFANLEGPITDASETERHLRTWNTAAGFKMNPGVVGNLTRLSAVSIANNHALDYGRDAYLFSIAALDKAGIKHAGGGANRSEARSPVLVSNRDLTVAFLAYTCLYQSDWDATDDRAGMAVIRVHTTYEPPLRVLEQPGSPPIIHTFVDSESRDELSLEIAEAKRQADVVVVSIHWGVSGGNKTVMDYQRELGRICIDAGAEVVFGHHPHVLQPIEFYRGKPICLSLGNLVFEHQHHSHGDVTAVMRVYLDDGRFSRLGTVPLFTNEQSNGLPEMCSGPFADEVVSTLYPTMTDEFEQQRVGSEIVVSVVG